MARRMTTQDGTADGLIKCPGSGAFNAKHGRSPFNESDSAEHYAKELYPSCWHCNQPLGCIKCSGIRRELLCIHHGQGNPKNWHGGLGPVCATPEALIEHGLLLKFGQRIEDYPVEWRKLYLATSVDPKYVPEDWRDVISRRDVPAMWAKIYSGIKPGPMGDVLRSTVLGIKKK